MHDRLRKFLTAKRVTKILHDEIMAFESGALAALEGEKHDVNDVISLPTWRRATRGRRVSVARERGQLDRSLFYENHQKQRFEHRLSQIHWNSGYLAAVTQPEMFEIQDVVGISGGKDSTAVGIILSEEFRSRGSRLMFLITPTGDELPDMVAHWAALRERFESEGHEWVEVYHPGGNRDHPVGQMRVADRRNVLVQLSLSQAMLPSSLMRWCTKMVKIHPYKWFLKSKKIRALNERGTHLIIRSWIGLRADEPERDGMFGEGLHYKYPLKERGMNVDDVWRVINENCITIPRRTDCARCPFQRLYEWYLLYRDHPDIYINCIEHEQAVSHMRGESFSIRTDSSRWPASLEKLLEEFVWLDRVFESMGCHEGVPDDSSKEFAAQTFDEHSQEDSRREWLLRIRRWFMIRRKVVSSDARDESLACRVCSL